MFLFELVQNMEFNNQFIVPWIIFAILAAFLIIVYYGLKVSKVKKTSERYLYLLKIPEKLGAYRLNDKYTYSYSLASKSQFDNVSMDFIVIAVIKENEDLRELYKKCLVNDKKMNEYKQMKLNAPEYHLGKSLDDKIYCQIEKRLCNGISDNGRPTVPSFCFISSYTSPQGRRKYQNTIELTTEEMTIKVAEALLMDDYQYESIKRRKMNRAQFERQKMTPALRYEVLRRDNFRCKICGRSQEDGVKLHVDHILPVSKGGKTEMNNLRTLCEDCNLGKKDKYDPNGIN